MPIASMRKITDMLQAYLTFCCLQIISRTYSILCVQCWLSLSQTHALSFLALVAPDTSDLIFPFQVALYWFQHLALILAPCILIWTGRFPVERHDLYWWISAVIWQAFFAYGRALHVLC
jgi:uncharacterized membrane protein YwaF